MVAEFEANLNHLRTAKVWLRPARRGASTAHSRNCLWQMETIHRRYHDPDNDASLANLAE